MLYFPFYLRNSLYVAGVKFYMWQLFNVHR